ncbi:AAA family ATPase [Amycolatopsis sp. NPDC051903]|uniref:AAA family ATPase n=1 Tax=Amycolatopsis sp. NPDC051903 TaxID=3363936 RepID=UPI0037960460
MPDIRYIELAARPEQLDTSRGLLRVLIGPPAAGKTTLCTAEGHRFGIRLSLDEARAELGAHEHDQDFTPAAIEHVRAQADALLAMGAHVTIDATSTTPDVRAIWLGVAREHQVPAIAVLVWAPLEQVRARNAVRARPVPLGVVNERWYRTTILQAADLITEGFHRVDECVPPAAMACDQPAPTTASHHLAR